jgi:hypothetical protein
MIDKNTGELFIDSAAVGIGPRFTRKESVSSILSNDSRTLVNNEPYSAFSVGSHEISGLRFIVSLSFYGDILESIVLTHDDEEPGSSRSDWSEEKELKRKRIHDQWLISLQLHTSYRHSWGEIWSGYDPRSDSRSRTIRYSWQGKPWNPPLRNGLTHRLWELIFHREKQ